MQHGVQTGAPIYCRFISGGHSVRRRPSAGLPMPPLLQGWLSKLSMVMASLHRRCQRSSPRHTHLNSSSRDCAATTAPLCMVRIKLTAGRSPGSIGRWPPRGGGQATALSGEGRSGKWTTSMLTPSLSTYRQCSSSHTYLGTWDGSGSGAGAGAGGGSREKLRRVAVTSWLRRPLKGGSKQAGRRKEEQGPGRKCGPFSTSWVPHTASNGCPPCTLTPNSMGRWP